MDWTKSLDQYLTNPPDDGFDLWVEQVYQNYSDKFYESIGDFEDSTVENFWLNKLSGKSPQTAARIIERAHSLYYKK